MGLVTFLYVITPFVTFRKRPLLRIDIADGNLYAFGGIIPFHDLFPLLLALLSLLFIFLFIAAGFGRLWCGWSCPQTVLSELAESFLEHTGSGTIPAIILRHFLLLTTSLFFATITCLYFVEPSVFLPPGFLLDPGWGSGTWLVLVILFYGDMAYMRRRFCTDLCPYGKILNVVTSEAGLRVAVDPNAGDMCKRCAACVTVCPMDLDVREGPNAECIQCGLCIEACKGRFSAALPGGEAEGIVHFYVGKEGTGGTAVPRRALIPLAAAALLAAGFLASVFLSSETRFQVRRSVQAPVRQTAEGGAAHFFTASIINRSGEEKEFKVRVTDLAGTPQQVRGQTSGIRVPGGGSARISFAVILPVEGSMNQFPPSIRFDLLDRSGELKNSAVIGLAQPGEG